MHDANQVTSGPVTSNQATSGPLTSVDLFARDLLLGPDGAVGAADAGMADGGGDRRLALFHAETDDDVHADRWEQHPHETRSWAACGARSASTAGAPHRARSRPWSGPGRARP